MSKRCGKRVNLVDQHFGKLIAVENVYIGNTLGWYCECECGGCRNVKTSDLRSGKVQCCGCTVKERYSKKTNQVKRNRKDLTQEELKKLIYYNPYNGIFTWRERDIEYFQHCKIPEMTWKQWNPQNAGKEAGNVVRGYRSIILLKEKYLAHRLAWFYMEGYWPEHHIDHIDQNPSNNKWDNLRHVSPSCNMKNVFMGVDNTTGVRGVTHRTDRDVYQVYISTNRKHIYIGTYKNLTEAVKERYKAEQKYGHSECLSKSSAYLYLKERGLIDE